MTQVIQVTNYPEQTFRVTLDGVPIDWRLYWSYFDASAQSMVGDGIEGQWYADLNTQDGSINLQGMAIVTGADMLAPYGLDRLGGLWCFDGDGQSADLTLEYMGNRHYLLYVPSDEQESFDQAIGWR